MCGISGQLNLDGATPASRDLAVAMTEVMSHRGPDGYGLHLKGPIALGHRRLSIIDLEGGAQPMANETGTVWTVFNGEIYNYRELRTQLLGMGHRFVSSSDTEVIVHAYEQWGEGALARLQGMFAIAIWNDADRTLLLARDRVGIKPLYYVQTARALAFASELKSLLVSPAVRRDVNPQAVDRFLRFHYLPGTETLFRDIHKLAPGHVLIHRLGHTTVRRYWDLPSDGSGEPCSFAEATEQLQHLLADTVDAHLMSDVPVGLLLSGGVDSSAVMAYAAHAATSRLRTYTVGFNEPNVADERPFARLVARRFGTEHHEVEVRPDAFRDFLPRYVWHMEEPVCEPPAVALYFLARAARESGTKVLLSGEGGDEAFGGYETYRNLLLLERSKAWLGPAKPVLRMALRSGLGRRWRRAPEYADLVDADLGDYYLGRTATPPTLLGSLRHQLYRTDFAEEVSRGGNDLVCARMFHAGAGRSALGHMLYVDTASWLPDDLLLKADKMTMAASTELRVPLLDHKILEFATGLPPDFKVRGLAMKRLLKAAVKTSVPPEVLSRPKAGFPVPYERWLSDELRTFVTDTLSTSNSAVGTWFDPVAVRRLLISQTAGGQSSKALFSLVVLNLWFDTFVSSRITPVTGTAPALC